MSQSQEQRPYFCLSAFPDDERLISAKMENVAVYLTHALHEPFRTLEFESSAESVLRNNGFDPNHDKGWKEAGVTDGRAGAVRQIRKAYLAGFESTMTFLGKDVKNNPYDYTAAAPQVNFLEQAVASFRRGHQGKDAEFLCSDEAWHEAGLTNAAEFQAMTREMFVDGKVGGYVLAEINPRGSDLTQVEELSVKAADYAIQRAFPELAEKLNIPKDIKQELVPKQSGAAAAFGQARDFNPD